MEAKSPKIEMLKPKSQKFKMTLVRNVQKVEMTNDEKSKGRNNIGWKSQNVRINDRKPKSL